MAWLAAIREGGRALRWKWRGAVASGVCACVVALQVAAEPPATTTRPWPHERSDLAPFPSIQFGELEDHVRYAWRRSSDPDHEVYLWLHVRCGSAMEEDAERGLAHTVEHLVLRRCGDRASGELKRWAEQHGMDFGPDVNGYTSHLETTYVLHLYRNDAALLRECLSVLRDLAVDGRFDDAELAVERGVIDAEEASRDDAEESRAQAFEHHFLAGSRIAERDPIGVRSVRDRFTAAQVERFYRRWYRPENFTLVMVGDVRFDPIPLLETTFGQLSSSGPTGPAPDLAGLTFPSAPLVHLDRRLDVATIEVRRAVEESPRPATLATVLAHLAANVATTALQRRLALLPERIPEELNQVELRRLAPEPWSPVRGFSLVVAAPLDRWPQAVRAVASELAVALKEGFTADEIVEAVSAQRRWYAIGADRDRTRLSGEKCACMLAAASDRDDAVDPAALGKKVDSALGALTVEQCSRALAAEWNGGRPQCALALQSGDEQALAKTLASSLALDPDAHATPRPPRATRFAYADPPTQRGKVVGREDLDEDVHAVDFENGVRVWIHPQESGRVEVRAVFGEGLSGVAPSRRWLPDLAESLFVGMGLGRHSAPEWRQLLADRDVAIHFEARSSAFHLGGNCASRELELESQLIAAHLADPGFRAAPLVRLKRSYASWWESLARDPTSIGSVAFMPEVLKADSSRRIATPADVEKLDLAAFRAWFEPQVVKTRLQVVYWGGLDLDATIAIAAATFGALPPRSRERAAVARDEHEAALGLRRDYTLRDGAKQAGVHVLFPTRSHFRDEATQSRLALLAKIYEDRLFHATREQLGLTYSPTAEANSDRAIEPWGWIAAELVVPPGVEQRVAKLALDVADELAKSGVTDEEVARLERPMLEEHDDREYHERLTLFFDVPDALARFAREREALAHASKAELDPLAARYLLASRADVAIVHAPPPPKGADESKEKSR